MLANLKIDYKKFSLLQISLIFFGYIVTLLLSNHIYANSFMIGGLTMFFANFIFYLRLLIDKQFSAFVELLIFYFSEVLKLCIVAFVTILLAIYIKPKLFTYIIGLILLQFTACLLPFFFRRVK